MRRGGTDTELALVVALYLLAAIVTFGHAWVLLGIWHGPGGDPMAQFTVALVCAVGWPLYWSGWFWAHL